jgi:hypothetical protein
MVNMTVIEVTGYLEDVTMVTVVETANPPDVCHSSERCRIHDEAASTQEFEMAVRWGQINSREIVLVGGFSDRATGRVDKKTVREHERRLGLGAGHRGLTFEFLGQPDIVMIDEGDELAPGVSHHHRSSDA